ncbi:MAG: hypothetical protein V1781_06375 [Bacteroidota bacterium]
MIFNYCNQSGNVGDNHTYNHNPVEKMEAIYKQLISEKDSSIKLLEEMLNEKDARIKLLEGILSKKNTHN